MKTNINDNHFGGEHRLCYETAPEANLQKLAETLSAMQQSVEAPTPTEAPAAAEKKAVRTETTEARTSIKLDVAASQLPKVDAAPVAPPASKETAPEKTKASAKPEEAKDQTLLGQAQKMFEDGKNYVMGTDKKPEIPAKEGEPKPEAKGIWEGAKKIFNDVKDDFQKSSPGVKAAYILSAFVGFLAARWAWRKAFGDGEKEGFVKSSGKWLASLGAAGAAVIAGKSTMDWWNKKTASPWALAGNMVSDLWKWASGAKGGDETPPPNGSGNDNPPAAGNDVLDAVRDGVKGAGKQFGETVPKGVNLAVRDGKFWVDLFNTNNMDEAMKLVANDGATLAYENGEFIIYDLAWRSVVKLPMLSLSKMYDWKANGKKPDDFWEVYAASGVSYFLGKNALTGNFKAFVPLTKKDMAWTIMKIGSGPANFVIDGAKFLTVPMQSGGMSAMKLRYLKYTLPVKLKRFATDGLVFSTWFQNEKRIINDIEKCVQYADEIKIMEQFGPSKNGFTRLFTAAEIESSKSLKNAIAQKVQGFLRNMTVQEDTPEILREMKKIANMGEGDEFYRELEKVRSHVMSTAAETAKAAKATTEATETATSGGKTSAKKMQQAPDAKTTAANGKSVVSDAKTAGKATEAVPAEVGAVPGARTATATAEGMSSEAKVASGTSEAAADVSKAAKTGKVAAGEKAAVETAEEGGKVLGKLEQAIRTNPKLAAILEHLKVSPKGFLTVLRNAKAMKLAGKALPYAGAGLQWWIYTFIDEPEWEAKLEKETDPLKKKIIENEMFSARVNWKLDAVGTPAALSGAGLTLLIGNLVRQQTNEGIVEGSKYMLQDRKELTEKSPGAILAEIQKSSPGSMVTYGQRAASLGESKAFEKGNTSARSEAYAAYFEKNVVLPPVTVDLLSAAESKDPANVEKRLKILNQDQDKYFTQSALSYIANVTKNTFAMVSPDELHNAEIYAKKSWRDWVHARTGQPSTFTNLSASEKQKLVSETARKEKTDRIAEMKKQIESGVATREAISFAMLESINNDLSVAESKILSKDYSNWSVANWTNENEMQQIARGQYQKKIGEKLRQISSSAAPLTEQSFDAARQLVLNILQLDPDALAVEGLKSTERAKLAEKGKDPASMTMAGILYGMAA